MLARVWSIIIKLPGFIPKVTPKKELVIRNPQGKPRGGLRYVVSHKSDFGNQEKRQLEL